VKILTRYVFKEMIGPTLLGFGFYTFIVLMNRLFVLAGLIIRQSLPAATVGKLLLLSLPHIVVLTIPMSILFGVMIAIGRLSSDSEIIAMRALGISTRTIYRPVFIFSFLVFLLNLYLMNVVLPRGNTQLNALKAEIYTSSVEKEIKPRVFYEEFADLMLYVNDVDPRTGAWNGVFVADSRSEDDEQGSLTPARAVAAANAQKDNPFAGARGQRIIVAQTGTLSIVREPTKQIWLNLRTAFNHVWDPRKPDRYDINKNDVQRMRLPDKFSDATTQAIRSFREMNMRELAEQAKLARRSDPLAYNVANVEIQKKVAIPFACIVFGVLGLPLGITNRRGGKSSGFSLSIAIILAYYVMMNNGEQLAVSGKVSPAVGMWTPNILALGLGIYLLIRANRDVGTQKTDRTWPQRLAGLFRRKKDSVTSTVSRDDHPLLSRLDITFPSIIDRYVLREFLKVLGLVIMSTAALFLIVDYTNISRDIRLNKIPFHTVFAYYRFVFFGILNYTLPISVLVATLVTFGMLSKNNEVTAIKSSGVSLYRIALPIIVIAGVMSLLTYLLMDFVLPYSNRRVEQIASRIKGKKTVASAQQQQKLWFLGKGRYLINFLSYDRNTQRLSQVQIFEMHPTEFRLTRRVYAESAKWDGQGWVFERGFMISFADDGVTTTYTPINAPLRLHYAERPADFATEVKAPDQMTFAQLRRYIETVRKSGYAAEELSVKLYHKTSWPFLSLVMTLIALPFAFKIGKRGALYGVGIALILAISYWMIFAIFTKFGEVGNLPPLLAAWSANVLFAIAAVYMFLNVET
jgi:LPS export ABC transporter permease LptG/LPS export ABC transporter permease LptF